MEPGILSHRPWPLLTAHSSVQEIGRGQKSVGVDAQMLSGSVNGGEVLRAQGGAGIAQLGAQDHQGYLPLARPDQLHDRHEAPVGPVGDLGSLEQQTASLSLVGRVRKEHPIARHRLPVLSA